MAYQDNFLTYLKWRGDLEIRQFPFNEIDALILCELVYVRLDGIVPGVGSEQKITIREAAAKYKRSAGRETRFYRYKEELLETLACSQRFAEMTLCNFVNTSDKVAKQQFAAMHINIHPTLTFVAFRGTDSTVIGWHEDFNMSYMMPVPAQQSAVDYVNRTMNGILKKYWFGGHSKGGNLAIYSAVFCHPRLQKKIVKVNSFDGPGFNRKMIDTPEYKMVEDKISAFVPEESLVGLLMEHQEDYKVVKSTEFGLLQHEGFSWVVDRDAFVLTDEVDALSRSVSAALQTWIKDMTLEERKGVVDAFFGVLEEAGIEDFSAISSMDMRTAGNLLKAAAKVPHEHREKVGKLMKIFIEENV